VITDLLNDPFIQSSLLPLLLGGIAVGVLRLAGGARTGRALAPAGITLAFLLLFALVVGLPAFPPPSSMGKLFWSAVAGLLLGVAIDAAGLKGHTASVPVAVWLVLALGWIAGPALDSLAAAVPLAVLLAVGVWIALAGSSAAGTRPAAPAATLLALALSVGVTALIGSSASLAQLGLALTAATGGFLLWNWPTERHVWGASGRVALTLPVLLVAILALYTQIQTATLLLALPALAAGPLSRRLTVPQTRFGLGTVTVTVLAVLPALAAVAATWALSGGEASPY